MLLRLRVSAVQQAKSFVEGQQLLVYRSDMLLNLLEFTAQRAVMRNCKYEPQHVGYCPQTGSHLFNLPAPTSAETIDPVDYQAKHAVDRTQSNDC